MFSRLETEFSLQPSNHFSSKLLCFNEAHLIWLCAVTYKRCSLIISFNLLLLIGQIFFARNSSLIGVEVCHQAKVPISVKQNRWNPYSTQTQIVDQQLHKIAAAVAVTKTTVDGKNPHFVERLSDVDHPGEDQRSDEHVHEAIRVHTWSARAYELHVKYVLQKVEDDYQQEQTHSTY